MPPKENECSMVNPECAEKLGGIAVSLRNLNSQLTDVHSAVLGCNEKPGLMIQVDRLQQSHNRQKWWTRAIAIALLTAIIGELVAAKWCFAATKCGP